MAQQPRVIQGPLVGAAAVMLVILMGTGMFYYQYYVLPATVGPPHTPQNITIELVAVQWAFMVNGTSDIKNTPIQVHAGDNVTFHLTATFDKDPSYNQHGFFIQGIMEVPITITAGKDVTVTIVPTTPGQYIVICTIFCGVGHGNMNGLFEVLP